MGPTNGDTPGNLGPTNGDTPGNLGPISGDTLISPARSRLGVGVALGVGAGAAGVGLLGVSAWLVVRAAERPPVLMLMVAIVAVRATALARAVFRYAERLVTHDAAYRVLGETRARVVGRLERLAPAGLGTARSGDLLARLVLDLDAVLDHWLRIVLPVTVALVTAAATTGLIVVLLPAAGAGVAVAVLVACTVVPWLTAWSARSAERSVAGIRGELAAATTESLLTAADLVAYGADGQALARLDDLDRRLREAARRSAWSTGLGSALLVLCVGAACLAGLLAGGPAVAAGELTGPVFAVVVLTPLALADVLGAVPAAAQLSVRVRAALARVTDLTAAPDPVAEPAEPRPVPPGPRTIAVRELRAGYPGGPDVLRGVDLDLAPGSRVVLTGPSGSGKSTLAAVLLRFLDPRSGRVELAGADVTTLAGDDVRRVVGLMTQESHVFDTTVAENLRPARPAATEAELREALRRARLDLSLDTMVGELGARLSGGERQRLALARLLLAEVDVLVLDEPTEHLDEPTGRALLADLYDAAGDRAVLLLTHRPEQAPYADARLSL